MLKIKTIIDRYNQKGNNTIRDVSDIKFQNIRFDKDNNILITVSHNELIKLGCEIEMFKLKNNIDGKNTHKMGADK